jgi:hypothetical protein
VKVIAKSASAFLIEIEDGYGRVLDLEQDRLFPPNSVDAILARGYWEPFTGDPSPLLERAGQLQAGESFSPGLGQSSGSQGSAAAHSRLGP